MNSTLLGCRTLVLPSSLFIQRLCSLFAFLVSKMHGLFSGPCEPDWVAMATRIVTRWAGHADEKTNFYKVSTLLLFCNAKLTTSRQCSFPLESLPRNPLQIEKGKKHALPEDIVISMISHIRSSTSEVHAPVLGAGGKIATVGSTVDHVVSNRGWTTQSCC
jgi:hypothetical protein